MTAELLAAALSHVDQGCVVLRETHEQNFRWANSAITTNGDTRNANLTVIASRAELDGTRTAVVSGQVADAEAASELGRRAAAEVVAAPVLDGVALPDAAVSDDFEQAPAQLAEPASAELLGAVQHFMSSPAAQFGYAATDVTTTYLATSSGTRLRHVQPTLRFEASARDESGSTWWGTNTLGADFERAASDQSWQLDLQRQTGELAPGRQRVILTPSAVADLMIYLAWTANGRDAVEGHNVFSAPGGTRLGQRLSERDITLFADPSQPGLGCASHVVVEANSSTDSVFDNGLPIGRECVIESGILTGLRASRPTARKFGLAAKYFADNLILTDADGTGSLPDLIARTDDAVLITCLWYIREVDPQNLLLTGLTRDGVYRVRQGQIVESLPNFRFNVSPVDLLGHIVDATSSAPCLPREWADWFTRTSMPALLVSDFNLSSRSEAR